MDDKQDPPPRSPIEFRLSVGAEDRQSLAHRLIDFARRVEHGDLSPWGIWGGAGSHGDYKLDVDEGTTVEQYRADLESWSQRNRNRATPPPAPTEGT